MKRILIANRGEIAVRIIRTARAMGYETVAVFSDADAVSQHVALADRAVRLGAAGVGESYLNSERVLETARLSGVDAVHPGYGFLSENADFAEAVLDAGLTWIGPPPEAMRVMGDKAAAKRVLANTAVPTLPGYAGNNQSDGAFLHAASDIGYPVMVKAAAGGGGRGMRLVANADELPAALASARSEAQKAFGSGALLLEKAVVNPRHVEVQVFGDTHGNLIHLGERDCSIQRRHQKVVEEAPCTAVSSLLRQKLGEAAVAAARVVGYIGAGTVEFLLDEAADFYFIEMNTRLQVEHPVTELVTGQDLVAWQLCVAEGEALPLTQEQITITGHAIEVRLYAEDPANDFLPCTGTVHVWRPSAGEGVRVDHGIASGTEVTPYYDAMVAKLIAWGETREAARRRLRLALCDTVVLGVVTNRSFLLQTIEHPTFVSGKATTRFIDKMEQKEPTSELNPPPAVLAALLFMLGDKMEAEWRCLPFTTLLDGEKVTVTAVTPTTFQINSQEQHAVQLIEKTENRIFYEQDGLRQTAHYAFSRDGTLWLQYGAVSRPFRNTLLDPPETTVATSSGSVIAPMPGTVQRVAVSVGDTVTQGETLLILEAMKMEHAIPAPFDGTVEQIFVTPGQQVQPGGVMVIVG